MKKLTMERQKPVERDKSETRRKMKEAKMTSDNMRYLRFLQYISSRGSLLAPTSTTSPAWQHARLQARQPRCTKALQHATHMPTSPHHTTPHHTTPHHTTPHHTTPHHTTPHHTTPHHTTPHHTTPHHTTPHHTTPHHTTPHLNKS